MINIRLESPILPEGAAINAEVKNQTDLDFLTKAILKVYEEADIARVPTPGYRLLSERVGRIEKAVLDSLPPLSKLEIANEAAR